MGPGEGSAGRKPSWSGEADACRGEATGEAPVAPGCREQHPGSGDGSPGIVEACWAGPRRPGEVVSGSAGSAGEKGKTPPPGAAVPYGQRGRSGVGRTAGGRVHPCGGLSSGWHVGASASRPPGGCRCRGPVIVWAEKEGPNGLGGVVCVGGPDQSEGKWPGRCQVSTWSAVRCNCPGRGAPGGVGLIRGSRCPRHPVAPRSSLGIPIEGAIYGFIWGGTYWAVYNWSEVST